MNLKRVSKPLALYTGLLSGVTVGLAYVLTRSGPVLLGLVGLGMILLWASGSIALQAPSGKAGIIPGTSDQIERTSGHMENRRGRFADMPVLGRVILYGLGLVLWSSIVLGLFTSGLQ